MTYREQLFTDCEKDGDLRRIVLSFEIELDLIGFSHQIFYNRIAALSQRYLFFHDYVFVNRTKALEFGR